MEQYIHNINALIAELVNKFLSKMQSGGRRGHRAVFTGVNGLVSLLFIKPMGNIWREGDLSGPVKDFLKDAVKVEPYYPSA